MNNISKKFLAAFLAYFISSFNVYAIDYVDDELAYGLKYDLPKVNNVLYEDDLVNGLNAKAPIVDNSLLDDFMLDYIDKNKIEKPRVNLAFDYDNLAKEKLKLTPLKYVTTKNKFLKEGDEISFKVLEDIKYKNKSIKKGEIIKAKVETISLNGAYGVPSSLKIGNFRYDNMSLDGSINIIGANRTLWLYPTIYTCSMFFGAGLLLIPIRGGHSKLKPNKKYIIEIN